MIKEDDEAGGLARGVNELARRLADGELIDWQLERQRAGDEAARREIEALAAIASIADAHRSFFEGASEAPPSRPRPGTPIGSFGDLDLLEKVGEGASAEVYRAWDRRLEREVAVKLVRAAPAGGQGRTAAALAEGRLLARLRHENVARVFRAEERDGVVGIEMEFVRGRTLAQLVAEGGPLGAREATLVGMDLCRALAAVHGAGLLHRDLKAQNVLREEGGRILLVDFGIGQEASPASEGGARRSVSGTPLYLAPELFAGGPPSVAADLYSLGVLLYFLATGRFPIAAKHLDGIREAHRRRLATPLREARADLPSAFVRAVERALAPEPAARFASAAAMESALAEVLGLGETTQILVPAELAARRQRRRRWLVLAAGLALLVCAALALPALFAHRQERRFRATLAAAAEHREKGELAQAITLYEEAARQRPEDAETYAEIAACQLGSGLFDQAIASSEEALRRVGRLEGALRHKIEGNLYLSNLQYSAALQSLRDAVTLDGEDTTSRRRLAMVSAYLVMPVKAVAEMEVTARRNPGSTVNWGELAILQTVAGQPDAALATLSEIRQRAAIPPDPREDEHRYLFWAEGLAWLGRGELAKAERAFAVLAQGSGELSTQAAFYRAQPALLTGRFYDALAALEEGFTTDRQGALDGSMWKRKLWVANIWSLLGEGERATAELTEMEGVPQHPIFLKFLRGAALAHLELGDTRAARRLLRRIEELDKLRSGTVSRAARAVVQGELEAVEGDPAAARLSLRAATEEWNDPISLFARGRFLARSGGCREAVPVLRELLEQKGLIFEDHMASLWKLGHLELARCQAELGRWAEAAASYRAFLEGWEANAPDAPLVLAARRELGELGARKPFPGRENS